MPDSAIAKLPITQAQYRAAQKAYKIFNAELFEGMLPNVLVTSQLHAKARGYFSPDRFSGRNEPATAHELALNPDCFTGRTYEQLGVEFLKLSPSPQG